MGALGLVVIVIASAAISGGAVWIWAARRQTQLREDLAGTKANYDGAKSQLKELEDARKLILQLNSNLATVNAEKHAESDAHKSQVAQLTALRSEIEEKFGNLATAALRASTDQFLTSAKEVFLGQKNDATAEIEKGKTDIANIVKPLSDSLKAYETELKEIEKARTTSYGGLNALISTLSTQQEQVRSVTSNLVNALKAAPKTPGRWAEETLRRVMELSGMVEYCDFETEKHFRGTDQSLRPDVVLQVAGGRTIIVDAKAPIKAYLEAIEATSDDAREISLKQHAAQMRERLTNLSSKSYWEHFDGSPDCVVMFVPGDNFVSAAFERDRNLFEDGINSRVLICTPTTFIALAKAISYGWRQQRLEQSALEVAKIGKELYSRLRSLGEHIASVGDNLERAVNNYNKFVGSLENSVLPQARRFNELGVPGTAEPIPEIDVVDTGVRSPQAGRDLLIHSSSAPALLDGA